MSKEIQAAYLKARRNVLLSLIGDRICDGQCYNAEMKELALINDKLEQAK